MHISAWKDQDRTEQKYEHPLKKFHSLNLEAAALFHKRLHHDAILGRMNTA